MKKFVSSVLISLLTVFCLAGFSFAGDLTNYDETDNNIADTNGGGSGVDYTLSPNVGLCYEEDSTDGTEYNLGAANSSGTKAYATTHDFEGIVFTVADFDEGTDYPAIPAVGAAWDDATWDVMGDSSAALPSS